MKKHYPKFGGMTLQIFNDLIESMTQVTAGKMTSGGRKSNGAQKLRLAIHPSTSSISFRSAGTHLKQTCWV